MEPRLVQHSLERIKSRKRVGLALGGGLVRGLAHIGVLAALEEAGIPIDYIAGTSVGGIIGVCYAAGMRASQIKEYARKFNWWRISRPVISSRGLITFDPLYRWMVQVLGDLQFADLSIPTVIVATDLDLGEPVEISSGPVAPAVQASCSVPGFVTPVEIDGRILGDGGISDMLPVDVLRQMGADYVIGVDIFCFSLRAYLGPLGYILAALEILLERAGGGITEADCLISPDLKGKSYFRFSKRSEFYDLGYNAVLQKLDCIRREIGLPDIAEQSTVADACEYPA